MTAAAARWSPAVTKEVRALLPTYGAALVAVVVGSMSESYFLIASGLLGFAFGSVTLGAQSFGHEYSHRTLGLLLAQPLDRRRLFLYKLIVLAAMLVTLTGVTLLLFDDVLKRAASPHTEPGMLVLAAACGLFVAPWLTMLCRSTLAAVVFTVAIPGLLATGADIVGGLIYGLHDASAIDRFRLIVFWRGMIVVCALSAIAGWRMFLRLEVIEGHGAHVQLPESLGVGSDVTAATIRRRHPVRALVAKELRLQQIAFVVAALFVVAWVGLAWLEHSSPASQAVPLIPLTGLYVGMASMLIGSLASAEERHLGTLEGQMLVPVPGWQQWFLKVGVVAALVLLFCGVLPAVFISLTPFDRSLELADWLGAATVIVLLTTGSLYVSSLCRTGVGALVASFPAAVATVFFAGTVDAWLRWRFFLLSARARRWLDPDWTLVALLVVIAGFVALLLWLGFQNHRTADRSVGRTATQIVLLAGYITAGLLVLVLSGVR